MRKKHIIIFGGSSLIAKELIEIFQKECDKFSIFCRNKNIVEGYVENLKNCKINIHEADLLDLEKNLTIVEKLENDIDGLIWISGFTGNDHKPIPLSQNEAMKMLKKADDSIEYIAPKYVYEVGQQVKVIDGPFASFNGMVEEVDEERGRLKISVSIFGRSTPVELEYTQVEKI